MLAPEHVEEVIEVVEFTVSGGLKDASLNHETNLYSKYSISTIVSLLFLNHNVLHVETYLQF